MSKVEVFFLLCLILPAIISAIPAPITDEEAALIDKFSKITRRNGGQDSAMMREEDGELFLIPTIPPVHRSYSYRSSRNKRQADGIGDLLGGLRSFRESFRETLNPMPILQSAGGRLREAASNTVTRGREMFNGAREWQTGMRGRLTEGIGDAWDGLRDNWEEFWDL